MGPRRLVPHRGAVSPMADRTVNLCFHGIGAPGRALEPGEDAYWISVDGFHRLLDVAAGDPRVRISFDDGNASDVAIGLPALQERGLRATFFVLAGRLDRPGSLSSDEVRRLARAGMTIGSHGMDHVPWRHLDEARLRRELVEARSSLQAVAGRPVEHAALPLGRYDRRVLRQVRRAGYASLHTSDRSWAEDGAWLQPRFSARRGDTPEWLRSQVLTRPPVRRRLHAGAVQLAKRLR
jgi:peptidoglycan/xylan/chitin deacetylase (PgdA/CDA1 family)